jgi:hypothetical protein
MKMSEKKNMFVCEVCGNTFQGEWTDFYGEATCINCGTPYQLLEPYGAKPNIIYPHIGVDVKLIPIFKEYWKETHNIHREGMFCGSYGQVPKQEEFRNWLKAKHPEALKEKD